MDDLTLLPWDLISNLGATGALVMAFFMVMRGTLATPKHQKLLTDENARLWNLVLELRETNRIQADNNRTLEDLSKVVGHTMSTLSERRVGGGDGR